MALPPLRRAPRCCRCCCCWCAEGGGSRDSAAARPAPPRVSPAAAATRDRPSPWQPAGAALRPGTAAGREGSDGSEGRERERKGPAPPRAPTQRAARPGSAGQPPGPAAERPEQLGGPRWEQAHTKRSRRPTACPRTRGRHRNAASPVGTAPCPCPPPRVRPACAGPAADASSSPSTPGTSASSAFFFPTPRSYRAQAPSLEGAPAPGCWVTERRAAAGNAAQLCPASRVCRGLWPSPPHKARPHGLRLAGSTAWAWPFVWQTIYF